MPAPPDRPTGSSERSDSTNMVSLFGATTQVTTGFTARAAMIALANSGKSSPMAMPTIASTFGCATIASAQVCEMLALGLSGDFDRIAERREWRNDRSQRLQLLFQRRQLDASCLAVIGGDDARAAGEREDRRAIALRQVAPGPGEGGGDIEQLFAGVDEGRARLAQQRFPHAAVAGERAGVRERGALSALRAAALENDDRLRPAHLGDRVEKERHVGHALDEGGDDASSRDPRRNSGTGAHG